MLSFFRKHRCCTVSFCILFSISAYFYLTYVLYEPDRYDDRHYSLPPLTETWTKTIEYKALPYVKFRKCLLLSFDYKKVEENLKKFVGEKYYDEVYAREYDYKYMLFHTEKISEEVFYKEAKEKPHFQLEIYRNNILLEKQDLYFSNSNGVVPIEIDSKKFHMEQFIGRPGYKQGKCYHFEPGSQYRLEIINDTIVPEFKDVDVFFTIGPITPKV